MTIKSVNTYKDYPVYVRAHKSRYNYVDEYYTAEQSKTVNINLQLFEGLDYSFKENKIDNNLHTSTSIITSDKVLWNKQNYTGSTHVLAPVGSNYLVQEEGYNNFTVQGTDTNIDEKGIATGFSTSSWFTSKTIMPNVASGVPLYFISKVIVGTGNNQVIICQNNYSAGVSSDNKWRIWDGGNNTGIVVENNKSYWIKIVYESSSTNLYYADGDAYNEYKDIPNDVWILGCSAGKSINAESIWLGGTPTSTSEYWRGSIDLSKTYIMYNDKIYWQPKGLSGTIQQGCLEAGLTDITSEKTYTAFVKPEGDLLLSESDEDKEGYIWANTVTIPTHTIVSNPYKAELISTGSDVIIENYIASGFSQSSWLNSTITTPDITTGGTLRYYTRILTAASGDTGTIVTDKSGHRIYASSSNWSLWDTGNRRGGSVISNQWYWVRIDFTGTSTTIYYLADDETYASASDIPDESWTQAVTGGFTMDEGMLYIGYNSANNTEYCRGSIDLLNTRIDINDGTSWSTLWKPLYE